MKVDMSRKPELANQTVQQGAFEVSYDEMGYAKRAVLKHKGPGYEVDGKTYPCEEIKRGE